jgi:SAM-dependent methyltransferase
MTTGGPRLEARSSSSIFFASACDLPIEGLVRWESYASRLAAAKESQVKRDPRFWSCYEQAYGELLGALKEIDVRELNLHNPVFTSDFCEGPLHPENSEWFRYQKTFCELNAIAQSRSDALKVLDYGMLFGIPTLAFAMDGHAMYAVDDFNYYGPSFDPLRQQLMKNVTIRTVEGAYEIPYEDELFDVVSFLAVIEHFPDSPRKALSEMMRVLKPGGTLIIDTPNAAKMYKRLLFFIKGKGAYPELAPYYNSEMPFTGHHREYNAADLRAVLEWSGFEVERLDVFKQNETKVNSLFTLAQEIGMYFIKDSRPYLWAVARKPLTSSPGRNGLECGRKYNVEEVGSLVGEVLESDFE